MIYYGDKYEFVRTATNGAEIRIVISKRHYEGPVIRRPMGRPPVLKKDNNEKIFGTSLEIYAECQVDGEFAELYTSSAYEFRVSLFKDDILVWMGFVIPELYSEPDIAPPYDVQIIATDGLGELKNFSFDVEGVYSVRYHLSRILAHSGLDMVVDTVSNLRFYEADSASSASAILDFRVDLSHEIGETCYDVLQRLLSSLNASITEYAGRWLLVRDTDLISLASPNGLSGHNASGNSIILPVASFGSMSTNDWWPVGQLSSVIEPAKNRLTLISPNNYKNNVLDGLWTSVNGAVYDKAEAAYVLPDEGSYITQKLDFAGEEVGYRLALRVTARNVGSGEEDQALGVRVVIDGRSYAGERQYWLIQPESSDRGFGSYMWKTSEGSVEADLAVPSDSDTSADAQDIDIILPLYRNDNRSYIYAKTVEVTVFNPAGIHDIYVYGISLSKYDQFEGYQANVVLDNGAREEGSSIDLSLSDGTMTPAAGNVFMSCIPLQPDADEAIISWGIGSSDAEDYIGLMAKDYSRQVALPRMSYKGVLNVPRAAIPVLFLRDNTYYFPRTYTYDLYNDEIEVDLISIPAADLSIESIQVGQIAQSQGVPSSGGSGGGGGIGGGVDLSGYAKKEDVATLADLLASMWTLDDDGNLVTDRNVIIKKNITIGGDMSSDGEGGGAVSGITGIKLNGTTYKDENNDGIIDLGTITGGLTAVSWSDVQGRPTKVSEFFNDSGFITSAALVGYATQSWVEGKYLSTAGGTINGTTTSPLKINTTTTDENGINFLMSGVSKAWIGYSSSTGAYIYESSSGQYICIKNGTPYYGPTSSLKTIIHSGNIGSQFVEGIATAYANQSINFGREGKVRMIYSTASNSTDLGYPLRYASGLSVVTGYTGWQMVTYGGTNEHNPYFRKCNDSGTWLAWRILAFLDDNVASAQALTHSNGTVGAVVNSSGNVGIGTISPRSKLDVDGDVSIQNTYIRGISTNPYICFTLNGGKWYCQAYTTNGVDGIFLGSSSGKSLKVDVNGNVHCPLNLIVAGDISA